MPVKQMLVNYVPGDECRIAITTDGRLEEFHAEKAGSVTFVGNIYVGRVVNVEPSIQAAFIDFGLEANGFLHISDVHPRYFPGDDEKTEQIGKKTPRRERPPIQQCLKRGQEVIVQVLKEGINTKGPTLTSYLSIPGRYLVMLPDMDRVGVSRRVEDEEMRREMKATLDQIELPEGFGFILRTAGIGRGKMELKRDLAYLMRLWKDIERRQKTGNGPRLLYAESDLLMRSLRDYWTADVDEIVVDNESAIRRASRFMKIVSPRSGTKLLNYDRQTPMFHAFGIEDQIARMHAREVPLPSGGYLVIDETEAMIAIDVNSGKMRSAGDAETTAYRTNVEAVDEICRQLRLRDIGGLVLCDLIDMMKREHRRDIENQFKELLKNDRAATKVLPISQFGIVEMTRQRQRGSLRSVHFTKCPACHGRGLVQRPESVAADALRSLALLLGQEKIKRVEMVVPPGVAGSLLSAKRQALGRLEYQSKKSIDVRISEDVGLDRVVFYAYEENGADIDIERMPAIKPPRDLAEWKEAGEADVGDWSVDTTHEERAPEPLPAEAEVEPAVVEPMLVDLTEEDLRETEGMQISPLVPARSDRGGGRDRDERGRGKRGRRGRGRGRDGDRDGGPQQQPQQRQQQSGGGGGRGQPPQHGQLQQRPMPQAGSPAIGASQRRGDSWDVAPSELPGSSGEGSSMVEAQPMQGGDGEMSGAPGEPGTGKKRRRGRRGGRRRRKGDRTAMDGAAPGADGHAGALMDAPSHDGGTNEDSGGYAPVVHEDSGGQGYDDGGASDSPSDGQQMNDGQFGQPPHGGGEGGGGKKRRRRRRGGRGRRGDQQQQQGGGGGGGQGGAPQPRNEQRGGGGGGNRGGGGSPSPQQARTPEPAPGPKPVRTLYGNRRKLAPGDIARVKREE